MQKKVKSNTTEKNSRKRIQVLLFCSFTLLVGGIATAVIIPYASTLPIYISSTANFTTDLLTEWSTIDTSGRFALTKGNEILVFSSSQEHVSIGDYNLKNFLYCDEDSFNTSINVSFTVTGYEIKDIKFIVNVCNEDGTEIHDYGKEYEIIQNNNQYKITVNSDDDLYINNVAVSYKKRVR